MEKRFEDAFKEKFDGAEWPSSEAVWNNIELELVRAEGGDMKRRVLFFKLLAAASVAFAMCFSAASYYYMQKNLSKSEQPTAHKNTRALSFDVSEKALERNAESQNTDKVEGLPSAESNGQVGIDADRVNQSQPALVRFFNHTLNESQREVSFTGKFEGQRPSTIINSQSESQQHQPFFADNFSSIALKESVMIQNTLPSRVNNSGIIMPSNEVEADPVALMMAKLTEREQQLNREGTDDDNKKENHEKLWASIGVAAGGFNTYNPGVTNNSRGASFSSVAQEQSDASGIAYSMGISMGTQVASRWVLQCGVNYITQSYDYTANSIATSNFQKFEASSLNTAQQGDTKMIPTSPYNVNNSMQFVSVPLQAGYLLVNKRFGVLVNAGVATDFFISNTVAPSNSNLSKTSQGNGADSPYRPLNFSGLMSTEFSYQLGKQYRVALSPGVRYPFNSIYKDDTGISSNPLTVDVGLKFRYLF